jgi:DNA-binding transcriptional MerR regulator
VSACDEMRGPILEKSSNAFRTISEVAAELDVPKHVLRFWEGKFPQLRPMKRGGGRRYYRPEDVELLRGIRWLLYSDGYTIKGVQRILRDNGVKYVKHCWRGDTAEAPAEAEPSFEIPNLAAEAASAAHRTSRVAERPAAQSSRVKAAAVPAKTKAPEPSLSGEQRTLLQSLLRDLEECRSLLQSAVEVQAVAQKRKPRASARRQTAQP